MVRFTLKAASKKKGLKKVVAKVIAVRRRVGKKVVIISLVIFLFMTMNMRRPCLLFLKVFVPKFQAVIWKIGISVPWVISRWSGIKVTVVMSRLPIVMSIEQAWNGKGYSKEHFGFYT